MYLKGSKWSMTKRRKPIRPGRIFFLLVLIAGAVYVNQIIVPSTDPLFIPTPTPTRSPDSYITEAESLYAEGKFAQAIETYEKAIESDPTNPSVFITLARLQVYTGNYEEAATNAENALLLNSNNSMAHALRGWALGFTGDYLQAEGAINSAIELDPNNAIAYAYRAEVLVQQSNAGQGALGGLDDAIEASRKAVELDPNILETHQARGTILEATGNYAEAVQELESAVSLNDNIADLHLALGRNYRSLQQYDKAVEEFTRAMALNPSDSLPPTYIARTYSTVGEFATAIQYAQQAIKNAPTDSYMWGNLGQMYYKNVQYQDAEQTLRLAVRGGTSEEGQIVEGLPLDYGRVAEYYYTYGLTMAKLGDCNEALQIAQLIQQGVPTDETAQYNAQEMINICADLSDTIQTPSPASETTAEAEEEIANEETPTVSE